MHRVLYKNNFNEEANLTRWPYMLTGGDIFNGKWEEIENDDHIQGFEKNIQEKKISLDVMETGLIDLGTAVDQLENVFEKDIIAGQAGRLYVGNSYLNCWIVNTEKDRWINDLNSISAELKVKTDYPYWITETLFQFRKKTEMLPGVAGVIGLDYEYDYEYEYVFGFAEGSDGTLQYMTNDHYTGSGFKMIIYGPCINPAIRIDGHLYELQATLYEGEYAIIDSSTRYSQDRAIYKVQVDGTKVDLFNSRNKDSDIWQKIPPGRITVTWNGDFGFDIILFSERGTPLWILR